MTRESANHSQASTLLESARNQITAGKIEESVASVKSIANLTPLEAEIILQASSLYYEKNRVDLTIEVLQYAAAAHPDNHALLIEIGNYQKLIGKPGDALTSYRSAIEAAPHNATPYIALAGLLLSTGHIREAEENYTKALEFDPNNKGAWMSLASIKHSLGDLEGYRSANKSLFKLGDHSTYVVFNLIDACVKTGELQEAENILRIAIDKHEERIEFYSKLVEVLLNSGKHKQALDVNRHAINRFTATDGLIIQQGVIYERMGEFDEALKTVRHLIETPLVRIETALLLSKISPYLNMTGDAIKLINYIITRDSLDPVPNNIAKALQWLEDTSRAI